MSPPKMKDYQSAVNMFNNGMPVAEIARRFGITRQGMTGILERRGCIVPKKKDKDKNEPHKD